MKWSAFSAGVLLLLSGCQPRVVLNQPTQSETQNEQALLAALRSGDPDTALSLVQKVTNINPEDQVHDTPLTLALRLPAMPPGVGQADRATVEAQQRKNDAVIGAILNKGADVNVRDSSGETVLMEAIHEEYNHYSVNHTNWVKVLLDKGANVNTITDYGTALSVTIDPRRGPYDLEIPRLLIEHGADVNATGIGYDQENLTVLMLAVQQQDFPLAGLLTQRGAKVECYDKSHKTPLLWASFYGRLDLVKTLLSHGADINARDILGQNAMMLAQKGGHPEVAMFLIHAGAQQPASVSGSLSPIVTSIPLFRQAPASRIRYSTGEVNGVPKMNVIDEGKLLAKPVTFSSLLTDPTIWNHDELNDIVYQLGRSFYSKDAYEFCGLVNARGKTYLGVRWYSPAASQQNLAAGIVLQMQVHGKLLDMILIRKAYGWKDQDLYRGDKAPALKRSPEGDLLLVGWDGNWKLLPNGKWKKIRIAQKQP